MKLLNLKYFKDIVIVMMGILFLLNHGKAFAVVEGISGPVFNLTAKEGYISTPDGSSVFTWGYAADGNGGNPIPDVMQYPGPTLIVEQGDTVTVNLENELTVNTSITFPGQGQIIPAGGVTGLIAQEAEPGDSVSYEFVASNAGTYIYHSGTMQDLQVEMGLVGVIVVRPADVTLPANVAPLVFKGKAYEHLDTAYHREYLFLLTEMDSRIHDIIESDGVTDGLAKINEDGLLANYFPNYWFINGRCAPDTLMPVSEQELKHQPYNCLPLMHPGEKLLMRMVNGGRDLHPFHPHGNHQQIIARDGRLRESAPGLGPDLTETVYTLQSVPGETLDIIFEWTGAKLGWDMYGHAPGDPLEPFEDPDDHGKPFPIVLPEKQDLTFGGFYTGSPYLGAFDNLPPGEGGLNPLAGYSLIWHSHTEKEIINNDIFPGGMLTMLIVVAHGTPLP